MRRDHLGSAPSAPSRSAVALCAGALVPLLVAGPLAAAGPAAAAPNSVARVVLQGELPKVP